MNPNDPAPSNGHPDPHPPAYRLQTRKNDSNSNAIVSFVFGILSWIVLPVFGAIVAIVTGHIARRDPEGRDQGFALAGLIMGYLSLAFTVIMVILVAVPMYYIFQEASREAEIRRSAYAQIEPQRLNLMLPEYEAEQNVPLSGEAQKYWERVDIADHTITARFGGGEDLPASLRRAEIQIEAVGDENGVISWHCTSDTLSRSHMPDYCVNEETDDAAE